MNLNKIIACAMLLGLLSGVSVAQRARTGGGLPGARLPNAVNTGDNSIHIPGQTTISPHASTVPSSAKSRTVTPNATNNPKARTVNPNATRVPDQVIVPDANRGAGRTAVPPIQ